MIGAWITIGIVSIIFAGYMLYQIAKIFGRVETEGGRDTHERI